MGKISTTLLPSLYHSLLGSNLPPSRNKKWAKQTKVTDSIILGHIYITLGVYSKYLQIIGVIFHFPLVTLIKIIM